MDEQQFSEKLGAFIARLRSKAGYSQEAFALHCDINRTYMTVIEQGKVSISLAKVAIISGKLGLTLSQFFALFEGKFAVFWRDFPNWVCVRSVPNILSWETFNEPKISPGFAAGAGSI